ncbi:hypothetical protein [Streptomyces marokkonensis]|uniref:hypothetical protein n=1 Tax=Streptomyces marokkonensis TaxID=324855 RepID=UPI0011F10890|nr:hypothetical protein [Streptomyces marokkonensis]
MTGSREGRLGCSPRPGGAKEESCRGHLDVALHLDQWAEAESRRTDTDARYEAGCTQALRDTAAFLRQTYYLP